MSNTVHRRASAVSGMASALSRQFDCPSLNPWPAKTAARPRAV